LFDRYGVPVPDHVQGVLVVNRYLVLEVACTGCEEVWQDTHSREMPTVVGLPAVLQDSAISETVVELVELDLAVPGREIVVPADLSRRPVVMQPLEVHWIDAVLLRLQPIAGKVRENDLREAIFVCENSPTLG
jgi:hypothetical protein